MQTEQGFSLSVWEWGAGVTAINENKGHKFGRGLRDIWEDLEGKEEVMDLHNNLEKKRKEKK